MKFIITIRYFHPGHNIALEDVRNAWLISSNETPVQLKAVIPVAPILIYGDFLLLIQ